MVNPPCNGNATKIHRQTGPKITHPQLLCQIPKSASLANEAFPLPRPLPHQTEKLPNISSSPVDSTMMPPNLFDLPPEILMQIIDLLLPFDIIPALHAANGFARCITPQHVLAQDGDGNTILHYLASDGQDSLIKQFLSRRVNCSIANISGLTPLIMAVHKKHEDVVKLLLQAGADISTLYPNGQTIMLNMKNCLNTRIVKLLINAGANISSCNGQGETVLVHAIRAQKRAVARVLIEAGADVNVQVREGSAWMLAVFHGDDKMVELLVEAGADTNARWMDERTPLEIAARRNHCQILRTLLDAGAAVSAQCDGGTTALHAAAQQGHEAGVRLLLDAGADVHLVRTDGSTVLHSAVSSGNTTIIRMLLDAGADLSAYDIAGNTILLRAIERHPHSPAIVPLIKLFINSGIDLSAKDRCELMALHIAASLGLHEVVKLLIKAGIDSSTSCDLGMTTLHHAVRYPGLYRSRITHALDVSANPSARDLEASTALHLATRYREYHTLLCLLDSPIDVSATDNCGRTALHHAVEWGWEDGVQVLLHAGVDVSIQTNHGWTAQNLAARGNLHSVAKAIHDAEVKAEPTVLSQACLGFAIPSRQLEDTELPLDQNLRHLHTKCHRAGASHSLIDAIQDLSAIGDAERIKILFETWTTEMSQMLPPGDISSLHVVQEAVVAAARNRHAPVVAYFLSLGVPITHTLVQGAKDGGSTESFQVLLDHGWDINTQYESKSSLM